MHANRDLYLQERDRYANLIASLLAQMKKVDKNLTDITTKDCIFRFNKDIRFSKDKSPYKTHFGAFISPEGRKTSMPWYYLHIQPNNESGIAGGSRCPAPAEREAIILHIRRNRDQRNEIMHNPTFKKRFGELTDKDEVSLERRLKTSKTKKLIAQLGKTKAQQLIGSPWKGGRRSGATRGDLSPEALDILLYSRFCLRHPFTDEEVLHPHFQQTVMKGFKLLKPFNDFLSQAF